MCRCSVVSYWPPVVVGNFLLNYNASAADDHVSVSVTGDDFNLPGCVCLGEAQSQSWCRV